MTDPRKGLPSASSFPRYALCPGSFLLEQQAPPEEPSEDAISGTRIHQALAGMAPNDLTPEEADQVEICRELTSDAFDSVLGGHPDKIMREERLWSHGEDFEPLYSGQCDVLAWRDDKAILIDYKTGRDPVQPEESWQLRALIALAYENNILPDLQHVTAAIIQPWSSPQVRFVRYSYQESAESAIAAQHLARAVQNPVLPRIPSEAACKYCRAKSICPETQALVTRMALTVLPDHRQGEILDPLTLASLLDRCSQAERVIAGIRSRAKHMLAEDPQSVPGWQLRPGAVRSKIVDLEGLWIRAVGKGITAEQFIGATTMTKTSLKALLRSALGLKGGGLEKGITDITGGLTEDKQAAPQLVRAGTTNTEQIEEGEKE